MKKLFAMLLVLVMALALCAVCAFATEYTDVDTVAKVQQALNDVGYECGVADGIAGRNTKNAISRYRRDNGLDAGELIDDELLDSLGLTARQAPGVAALAALGSVVTGDFDAPAPVNPQDRYDYFFEETDGSEETVFMMLDMQNDEVADIAQYGALYMTEHDMAGGQQAGTASIAIQESPYGKVIVTSLQETGQTVYTLNGQGFYLNGDAVERFESFSRAEFDALCESYHFPYGNLEVLNGVRQDDNGYTYFLVRSDDSRSFEFVLATGARVVQLRVYERDANGTLALSSYIDYDVGPALEIPQAVLDAMGESAGN